MSYTDYKPYQSRLFNFFHQQTRRWGEKVQRAARHAKVKFDWSLEALLHSAVLMMRKVIEFRGKRLKPGKNPNSSTSREYNEIQKQELINSQGNLNPSLSKPADNQLPGIETQILPPPQGAIAFFDTTVARFESNALVPFSQVSGELLALIQTQFKIFVYGEKAVKTTASKQKNEFLELISTALNSLFIRNQNNTDKLRVKPDKESPSTPLTGKISSTLNPESQEIVDPWLTSDDLFGNSQETPTEEEKAQTSNNLLWLTADDLFGNSQETPPEEEKAQTSNNLPWLTADDLFGNSQETPPEEGKAQTSKNSPWLTLNDLFGNSQETPTEKEKAQKSDNTPYTSKKSPQNWFKGYQQLVKEPEPDIELVKEQPPSINIAFPSTSSELDTTTNNQLETNPDFIETSAKMVGYTQHPLETILEWLDNGMLWLEEKIITAFNFIQNLWRKNIDNR